MDLINAEYCSLTFSLKRDKTGALGYSEFRGLWAILGMWKVRPCQLDVSRCIPGRWD